jgi:hypothetical protein
MTLMDLGNNVAISSQILPGTYTADQAGVAVDTAPYAEAIVIANIGTMTHASNVLSLTVMECDTSGGTYTAAKKLGTTDDAVIIAATTANDEATYVARVDLNNTKRFIKVPSVETGDSGDGDYAVTIVFLPYNTANADAPTISV